MNRAQLKAELQATGFGSTTVELVRQENWLNQAYLWVWHARDSTGAAIDWSFKKVDQGVLAVAGSATPTMPPDFGSVDWIDDDLGNRLVELAPDMFDQTFAAATAHGQTSDRSYAYKVVNRQVTLGPAPSGAGSYRWTYNRRVSHTNGIGNLTSGTFTDDGDTPLWPDHHMVLVHCAALIGHAMNSNPFASIHAQLRDDALQAMRDDLEHEFAPAQVWGDGGQTGYGG